MMDIIARILNATCTAGTTSNVSSVCVATSPRVKLMMMEREMASPRLSCLTLYITKGLRLNVAYGHTPSMGPLDVVSVSIS